MRNILIFVLPVATVFCCVVLALYASGDPLKVLNDSWSMVLPFVQDVTEKFVSIIESVGQTFTERLGVAGMKAGTAFIDKLERLDFVHIASALSGEISEWLFKLWNLIIQAWNQTIMGITTFFQWIQSLIS